MKKKIMKIICGYIPIVIAIILASFSITYLTEKCGVQPKVAALIGTFEMLFCFYGFIFGVIAMKNR
ncbi:MAG: hypothetical protein E7215_12195 [Clostridium sulfidigenes]|uniref:Uncharacterized protein n=1 Tax=Clostridium sulfidigenes TaxID=318464 RepID=A0A927W9V6_9CLOT|nr:hypothetical protein [Clostridium sulfidigenes]